MADTVISIENISKAYQLGVIGTGTFYGDIKRWWARQRGKPDPYAKIGIADHGNRQGEIVWALSDVNLQVQQSETLGIIGRNGAGKSTLLKILSRVTAPTTGEIKVKGRIASLLEVGTGFHPELTGRENIFLNGAILGMTRSEVNRKLDEIVDFSGVEQYIDTPVKRYSSGMYVRLAFAVAAHLEPEILIVDEVLAVGDIEFQKKCLGKMSDVASQGRTVLFVSHNMAAIESLCNRCIVIDKGAVHFDGRQTRAIEHYLASNLDTTSGIPLADRTDRHGSGIVRYTGVAITDRNGTPQDVVQSGDDIELHLSYESQTEYIDSTNLFAAIMVTTTHGVPVFTQSTRVTPLASQALPQKGMFICKIPDLPLPASTYLVKLTLKYNEDYADSIANAVKLTVVEGDFFKTGKYIPIELGTGLVRSEWRISD